MNSQRGKGTRRIEFEHPNQRPVTYHIDDDGIGTATYGEPVKVQTGTPRLAGELPNATPPNVSALSEADFIRQMQMDADMADQQPRTQISDPWDDPAYVETNRTIPNPYPPVKATSSPQQVYVATNADVGGSVSPLAVAVEPRVAGQKGILGQIKDGFMAGYDFQQSSNPNDKYHAQGRYTRSVIGDALQRTHLPAEAYQVPIVERAAIPVGRVMGDLSGFGTQSKFWNIHPMDITSTESFNVLKHLDIDPKIARAGAYGTALALGVGSNNFNPLNVMEGGRQEGFQAISADEDDPRKSTNPVLDMVFNRGMLGRTGQLLPWEQFTQERPDVSYDQYDAYKQYLRDPGLLGLAKGTTEGVDGPEARIMGYRVTPLGAAAALGTLGTIAGVAKLAGRRRS